MAGTCCGVNIGETQTSTLGELGSKSTMKVMKIRRFSLGLNDSTVAPPLKDGVRKKRRKIEEAVLVFPPEDDCLSTVQNFEVEEKGEGIRGLPIGEEMPETKAAALPASETQRVDGDECPKFGITSVCGRRRDMEDAVAIQPSFGRRTCDFPGGLHFFGVFDGHGCSHVANRCKDRMHKIVEDELKNSGAGFSWEHMMSRSFLRMDKDVGELSSGGSTDKCRCQMRTPQCEAVGSTAVVAVISPDKIIVSNCGDSRAVLCRNGVAIPLSVDHKPDRPDELRRIQDSDGRVIFWDGPRVLGVLAMSRAIGDNYLKPYVIPEPEVTITERTPEDECLILASDGLWDVVSNQTACRVARMCLQSRGSNVVTAGESSDQACSDASMLLMRLALARHSTDNVSVVVVDLRRSS